jgi:suppressor of tumorigenicity protein 13
MILSQSGLCLIHQYVDLETTGKLDDAVEHLTNAILLNPLSAIMYGTRGKLHYGGNFVLHKHQMLPPMHANLLMGQQLTVLWNSYVCPASVFIKMKKPVAAIRDANAALEVIHLFHLVCTTCRR